MLPYLISKKSYFIVVFICYFSRYSFFIFGLIYYLRFSKKNLESIFAAIIVSASIHLSFFIIFPLTFERSVTMYLLNSLSQTQLTKSQLKDKLIKEYIVKNKAVNKRLIEQKIIIND